ncbi:MAG: hypothetical protein E7337_04915 [Clostridiales bacterium]|nr:hypothetical protein [Clostridiales bacterium]
MDKKINARKKAQRLARQRKMRNRRIALTICLMLAVSLASIGGTIAWLTAESGTVTNTFTSGNVTITLDEGDVYETTDDIPKDKKLGQFIEGAERVMANEYQVIPGSTYDKDPKVTVVDGSEDCYLFVEFVETNTPKSYFDYESTLTSANGWNPGDGSNIPDNVWYRTVLAGDTTKSWELLKGNKITVNATKVTETNMDAAKTAKLEWTAYACQKANVDSAADAWAILNPTAGA